jgi:hypothetical protein
MRLSLRSVRALRMLGLRGVAAIRGEKGFGSGFRRMVIAWPV